MIRRCQIRLSFPHSMMSKSALFELITDIFGKLWLVSVRVKIFIERSKNVKMKPGLLPRSFWRYNFFRLNQIVNIFIMVVNRSVRHFSSTWKRDTVWLIHNYMPGAFLRPTSTLRTLWQCWRVPLLTFEFQLSSEGISTSLVNNVSIYMTCRL